MSLFFSHVEVPFRGPGFATPRDRERENFDPCHDYSAVTPKPAHRWTDEQRTVLCLLVEEYAISWPNIKLLFDGLFRAELSSPSGPSTGALRSMHHTLRRSGWSIGSWTPVCGALESQTNKMDLLADSELDTGDESESTLLGDNYEMLNHTPSKHTRNIPIGGVLEIPQRKSSSNKTRQKLGAPRWQIPKLGYRSYGPGSQGINGPGGFVAGLFVHQAIISQPDPTSLKFKSEAVRHVARAHTGPTPFISVTPSLIWSLHIALKNPLKPNIAIIDLHKAGALDASDRRSHEIQNIHWVQSLNLDTGHYYRGRSELLVWGNINRDAILSVVSPAQLIACLPQLPGHPDLFQLGFIRTAKATREIHVRIRKHPVPQTYETGMAIGSLAQQFRLSADLLHLFVGTVVKEWKLVGRKWEHNQNFIQGVVQGFEQRRAECKPKNRSFEDFLRSLESFVRLGDPGVADESDTTSYTGKTGAARTYRILQHKE